MRLVYYEEEIFVDYLNTLKFEIKIYTIACMYLFISKYLFLPFVS